MSTYNQNPFASTHALDTNPFEDPQTNSGASYQARQEELARREAELARREAELTQKADHIRTHGRNNFPPCECQSYIEPAV
jgi:hypothetical protein